jgi:glycosyltransferase involved in cell wall biosynthesis
MINMKKFIIALSSGYENLCDRVIAPSQSIKEILINRDVTTPIEVVPTGVDVQKYSNGNGSEIREKFNIPKDAFLVGYVGRVTKEKNLIFLAKSLSKFLQKNKNAYAIVVGSGTLNDHLASIFDKNNISDRTILPGSLTGSDLINAYHSLNAFVFASKTETQGMVIIEAMAAGVPVVAIDATGITDVLDTTKNGYLINSEKRDDFAQALEKLKSLTHEQYEQMCENARKTANNFSMEKTTQKMLNIYQDAIKNFSKKAQKHQNFWDNILHKFKLEFSMLSNAINAVEQGFNGNKK